MKLDAKEQDTIRHYLLGQLPQADSARLEERLLSDSDFFEELLVAEDELIDQYLGGVLSQAERPGFETHFLAAPERQKKVRFARNLKKYIGKATPTTAGEEVAPESSGKRSHDFADASTKKRYFFSLFSTQNPILSYSLAAAVVLAVVGVSWIAVRNWRTPQPLGRGNVLAVVLTPGLTRDNGGAPTRIRIPSGGETVELWLQLPNSGYKKYRTVLLADDGSQVWASGVLGAVTESQKSFVVSKLPARLLAPGDYRMKVHAGSSDGSSEEIATYPFRVLR